MHLPKKFKETDQDKLYKFIQDYPFGTLIRTGESFVDADHIPFFLKAVGDGQVTLQSHIAKANPLWKVCAEGQEILLIFHGPNAYVSPNYYPSKQETAKAVPTWNYSVVHVRGRIHFKHQSSWILQLLNDITNLHESKQSVPWSVADAADGYTEKLVKAVVGLEVAIEEIVGNFKLSQNKNDVDYWGVVNGLASSKSCADVSLAMQMRHNRTDEKA